MADALDDQERPWEPPLAGNESAHLVGMLERLRTTFRWKADDLDVDELRQRIPSSDLTIGGLLKHLAVVEDVWLWRIEGREPVTLSRVPADSDAETWQFRVGDQETADDIYSMWDSAVQRSRERLVEIIANEALDEPGSVEFDGMRPSIRRHVCDLIEEYGRHTGHADLLREAIDGRVGEDPPAGWRPVGARSSAAASTSLPSTR